MNTRVYGEPDNWKQLRPVRWGDAVRSEQSDARFLPCCGMRLHRFNQSHG
jgi:hypothetical protein